MLKLVQSRCQPSKFDLEINETDCTVTVLRDGVEVAEGTNVLNPGDVLTISAEADEGTSITSFKVNNETFVSGNTHTVSGNVTVEVVAE